VANNEIDISFSLPILSSDMKLLGFTTETLVNPLAGVIFAHPLKVSISECVNSLQLIAEAAEPEDVRNLVIYLPVR
jgi:hypothetical protein